MGHTKYHGTIIHFVHLTFHVQIAAVKKGFDREPPLVSNHEHKENNKNGLISTFLLLLLYESRTTEPEPLELVMTAQLSKTGFNWRQIDLLKHVTYITHNATRSLTFRMASRGCHASSDGCILKLLSSN